MNSQEKYAQEKNQQDINIIDETDSELASIPEQYEITSFGADYDVEGIVKRLNRGDIVVPDFQRDYVWNLPDASRFIESLLLGLPVPGVFLAREQDSNKLLVIDGQQRLKTLQFFYQGYFNPKPGNTKMTVFRLKKVQKRFEGLTYEELEEKDKVKLNDSIIHATIVKQESPEDNDTSIYHIFERLNNGGQTLTAQEIRTATYHGNFIDLIKELNNHEKWREIFGKKSNRLKDQEFILRFLAMYFDVKDYERPMVEFINKFTKKHRQEKPEFINRCKSLFINTIDTIQESIGNQAFRPERAINAAVFDSVMVGLARRLEQNSVVDHAKLRDAYQQLVQNHEYAELVSQSTADEKNVASRIKIATDYFKSI
ncbi:MAG: DUF262 domain-containing protein [Cyanobacteriota bacterium]